MRVCHLEQQLGLDALRGGGKRESHRQRATGPAAGLTLDELYGQCREKWAVSTMDQLKTFITEFKDHALMSVSHHLGGGAQTHDRPLQRASLSH